MKLSWNSALLLCYNSPVRQIQERSMPLKITVEKGSPYPLGVTEAGTGMNFAYVSNTADCGLVLYKRGSRREWKRIAFPASWAVGSVFCMQIFGLPTEELMYCFWEGEELKTDERAFAFWGDRRFGQAVSEKPEKALFPKEAFDWGEDRCPRLAYEESVCYCMHVRGFTRHSSSGVQNRGTFLGVAEKLPYLKQLGITTLELQPVYEFWEREEEMGQKDPFAASEKPEKLNYWGYARANYYTPKRSYAKADAVWEFKTLVQKLHKENMEVILQFYFTEQTSRLAIQEILRYWVLHYHVDGFHLKGASVDPELIASDPLLSHTKLWYYGFSEGASVNRDMRYLAAYREDYRYDMRRFLKGDEGMLPAMMYHLKHNPKETGQINYLTNYDGLTMADLVSYDRKHNEENGEDNKDGNDYNASWNCGQEGSTRKKSVLALRRQQMKNAWMLLLLSQGTPLFFMGDEFCNTQKGNNNPYCQDNEITWLNWKNAETNRDMLSFVQGLLKLRREHPVFRQKEELRLMDYASCGYPDLSYHGEAPWKPELAGYSRQLGVMYCGRYAYRDRKTPDDFFYVAYNMHWEAHRFSLPRLPKEYVWKMLIRTDGEEKQSVTEENGSVEVAPRSIELFIGVKKEQGERKS